MSTTPPEEVPAHATEQPAPPEGSSRFAKLSKIAFVTYMTMRALNEEDRRMLSKGLKLVVASFAGVQRERTRRRRSRAARI